MTNDDSPRAYHHGNLRAELLDTAIEQLREQGTEDLSLRALARAIGVSQTAPYRHFADKGELLAAMATRGYRNLLATLESAGRSAGGSWLSSLSSAIYSLDVACEVGRYSASIRATLWCSPDLR